MREDYKLVNRPISTLHAFFDINIDGNNQHFINNLLFSIVKNRTQWTGRTSESAASVRNRSHSE